MNKKVAIITGASSGVGQATAVQLAEKGYDLVLAYGSNEEGANTSKLYCEKKGAQVALVKGDISREETCKQIAETAIKTFSRVDALVNNAGTTKFCNHHELDGLDPEDFQRIYAVNAIAPFLLVRELEPVLREAGGSVVNVASTAGLNGIGSSIAYCASKAALINMTKSLARVLGPEVRINAVCPGFIQGEWLRQGLGEQAYEKVKAFAEQAAPLKATSTPEDIAEAVCMFIDGPGMVTGECLVVDGGRLLG